jgi:hypothetical protein
MYKVPSTLPSAGLPKAGKPQRVEVFPIPLVKIKGNASIEVLTGLVLRLGHGKIEIQVGVFWA